jgi:hypothetical protein
VYLLEDVLSKGDEHERHLLVNDFLTHMRAKSPEMEAPQNFQDPSVMFEKSQPFPLHAEREFAELKASIKTSNLGIPSQCFCAEKTGV